jgi:nucleotidyltransferase/DNA polymerase involved in DNA repair
MRIACIHIPQFALQCASRLDPALRGAAVAVVGGADPGRGDRSGPLHSPVVVACSRAAWALGVRLGMTAAAARRLSPELEIVTADPSF